MLAPLNGTNRQFGFKLKETLYANQGVVAILRRRVFEAIDLGHVELEPGMEAETVAALSAHSFRVGLTQDLFELLPV